MYSLNRSLDASEKRKSLVLSGIRAPDLPARNLFNDFAIRLLLLYDLNRDKFGFNVKTHFLAYVVRRFFL
jgi:hypothetical protein